MTTTSSVATLSVLIVEDCADTAESLAELLDIYGYRIRVARTGEEALRLAAESPPDAVLLDIGLPGMDGCAVARSLGQLLGCRPLLAAVTGYTHLLAQAHAAGIEHYFVKPVDTTVLDNLLRLYCAARPR